MVARVHCSTSLISSRVHSPPQVFPIGRVLGLRGAGERFGCRIIYSLVRSRCALASSLSHPTEVHDTVVTAFVVWASRSVEYYR